jgi:4-alpha-glucanotransferase
MAGWWEGRDIDWRTQLDLLESGATEDSERQQRAADRVLLWQALTEAGCASGDMPPADAGSTPLHEMLAFIGKTPAPLAILPLEDALGLVEQPNVPGTVETHPNWRRRMPAPAGLMLDDPTVAKRLATLHAARKTR